MAMTQVKLLLMRVLILFPQAATGVFGQCSTPLINLAVLEGTQDTVFVCNSPRKVSWEVKPTTDEIERINITSYSDIVAPLYSNLFDVNQTGLVIKTAQGKTTVGLPPISTAGLYVINYPNSTRNAGAKLLVVREPPTCSNATINSTHIIKNCSVTYGDVSNHPIDAKMTWTSDGNFYRNDTPVRRMIYPYLVSTSTITIGVNDPATYQCRVTFTEPRDQIQFKFVAKNAPKFSAYCNSPAEPIITPSSPECNCEPINEVCPSVRKSCSLSRECQSDGTNYAAMLKDELVVGAELYAKCDNCCPESLVCGVVVTLKNESRWLIYDAVCDDAKWEIVVVNASCLKSSENWKLLADRNVTISKVDDYVIKGGNDFTGRGMNDATNSCRRMMTLP